ncbi:DUF1365 domain-containing protein [Arcobacter sp. s6]|uniref:DUF1365 domain-containing protein n=1 Tax=Arcobacter sp. s6 TaxID=3230363 RepID=UPI0034A02A77
MKNLTNHKFYEGTIYHKRFHPKVHEFKYNFYLLDINLNYFEGLKNILFSINKLNLLSFKAKDHFGKSNDFLQNVDELLEKFNIKKTNNMRFFTLPRVLNFVFNPISVLIVFDNNNQATHLLAEVHNYNKGRVVYPILLEKKGNSYTGKVKKDMYVSPFFKSDGVYEFQLKYDENKLFFKIDLFEDNEYKLTAIFNSKAKDFNKKSSLNIFFKYMFSTFLVVTRTYFQAVKLFIKGLKIYTPRDQDKERRY